MSRLILPDLTAADLMAEDLVSIEETATVPEAIALLSDRGFSAAPVIDETGRAVGVVTKADILIHDRELSRSPASAASRTEATAAAVADATRVEEIMTPVVFSVTPMMPVDKVVEEMLALKVQQVFVVDHEGTLVGVINALDVLRHLRPE